MGVGELLCLWTAVFTVYGERFRPLFVGQQSHIQQAVMTAFANQLLPCVGFLLHFQRLKDTYSRRNCDYWFDSVSYDDQETVLRTLERGADLQFIDQLLTAIRESPESEALAGTKIAVAIRQLAETGELHVEGGVGQALRALDQKYNDERYYRRYARYRQAKLLKTGLDPRQGVLADIAAEWADGKSGGEQKLTLKELAQQEGIPVSEIYHYQEKQQYRQKKRR